MPFSKQKQPQKGYLSFVIVFFREARPCGLGANLILRQCLGEGDLGVPPKKPTACAVGLFSGTRNRNRTCNYPLGVFIIVRVYLCVGDFLAK